MSKYYEIPVEPHIFKMLRRDYAYDGVLEVKGTLMLVCHNDTMAVRNYFSYSEDNRKIINVSSRYFSRKKLYFLVRMLEREFRFKMHNYVDGQVKGGAKIIDSIRDFLAMYDLDPEEYQEEAARKSYQRWLKRKKNINQIALWK